MHIYQLTSASADGGGTGVSHGKFVSVPGGAGFAAGEESARGLAVCLGFDNEVDLHTKLAARYCPGVSNPDGLTKLRGELGAITEEDIATLANDGAIWLVTKLSGEKETAAEYLHEVRANAAYVFDEPAVQAAVTSNDGGTAERDTGHGGYTLATFTAHAYASAAKLTIDECAALRIYTSSIFRLINGPLRTPPRLA
jgi:hypothetical protein